eukprot:TRINITY_DN525_c0_g1_i1.p1 TRINITY_DN525_c0_g1~~TRINITY_DN525_c0_g1_i1.p1  ORF type:complete len:772 (-),score=105.97 TRINITY_DN525_c0_g1_i1:49-2364(-)
MPSTALRLMAALIGLLAPVLGRAFVHFPMVELGHMSASGARQAVLEDVEFSALRQALISGETDFEFSDLPCPGVPGRLATAKLQVFHVLKDDATIVHMYPDGSSTTESFPRNQLFHLTGSLADVDGLSTVLLSVDRHHMTGIISTEQGIFNLEHDTSTSGLHEFLTPATPPNRVLLSESEVQIPTDGDQPDLVPSVRRAVSNATALEMTILIECDQGCTASWSQSYLESLIAGTSAIYYEQIGVVLKLGRLRFWHDTSPFTLRKWNDYTSNPSQPTSLNAQLVKLRDWYWANDSSSVADVRHLLTDHWLGGLAYLSTACGSYDFGVSGLNGNWLGTTTPSYRNWDALVLMHELGHNFGTGHTHNYNPPLDTCYTDSGGAASGADCVRGTIMSYCHVCGGTSNIDLKFKGLVKNTMRTYLGSACGAVPPTAVPTAAPTGPSFAPTTGAPTAPTIQPTPAPTLQPTTAPTGTPSVAPTVTPSVAPTTVPTGAPTAGSTTYTISGTINLQFNRRSAQENMPSLPNPWSGAGIHPTSARRNVNDPDLQTSLKRTIADIIGIAEQQVTLIVNRRSSSSVDYEATTDDAGVAGSAAGAMSSSSSSGSLATTLNTHLGTTSYSGSSVGSVSATTPSVSSSSNDDGSSGTDWVLIAAAAGGAAVLVAAIGAIYWFKCRTSTAVKPYPDANPPPQAALHNPFHQRCVWTDASAPPLPPGLHVVPNGGQSVVSVHQDVPFRVPPPPVGPAIVEHGPAPSRHELVHIAPTLSRMGQLGVPQC